MIVFRQESTLKKYLNKRTKKGQSIGFVPTMGALHQGHISLITTCKTQTDICVCSIFVNPTQFNDKQDFEKYPVTIADDILKLEQAACDLLFLPSVEEMYPEGLTASTIYQIGHLENLLEGQYRPGHFQGVCQVVDKLLSIVEPHKIFMGQKDYQQSMVIKRLIETLHPHVELVVCKTVREEAGLAMSSRNVRLSKQEKQSALVIFNGLENIKKNYKDVSFSTLINQTSDNILQQGFDKVDYVSIADAETLEPLQQYDTNKKYVALIAAFINGVRLIDNMLLEE